MHGFQVGIGINRCEVFTSRSIDIEFAVLESFKGHSAVGNVAIFQFVGRDARAGEIGVRDKVLANEGFNHVHDEGAITDLELGAVPPQVAAFFNVFLLGRVSNPDAHDGVEVGGGFREGQFQGIASFVSVVSASGAIGMGGFDTKLGGPIFALVISSGRIGRAPFGGVQDFIGDRGVFTGSGRVDVALEGILKALGIERGAVAVFQTLLQGEGQLGRIGIVGPLVSSAGDGFQLLIEGGQAQVNLLQGGNFDHVGRLLRVDDIGVSADVDAQNSGLGFGNCGSHNHLRRAGNHNGLDDRLGFSRSRGSAASRKDHAGNDQETQ